ncbi:MAG: VOC family protein [Candidatus Babeliales bacterium]|nr:VOC family protein [Candidatus Babeliales bacterium]
MITKITHLTLFVHNQNDAVEFYTEKVGFKVHTDAMFGPEFRWLTLHPQGQSDFELVLMLATNEQDKALVGKQGGSKPLFTLESNDIEKDYESLLASGIIFATAPEKQPWGTATSFKDLYGNEIYLVQV